MAKRDRSGLTAKESKIVSKKSRLFDSNTQGIGLPQKSSKATIKAASKKVSSKTTTIKPGMTKGKAKVESRINRLNEIADYRTGGAFGYTYKKGKLKEVVENSGTKKVKPRNIKKVTDKMAPSSKKESKKFKETFKGTGPFKTPKVPVKPRGGLRAGGSLGGGGGMNRTNR